MLKRVLLSRRSEIQKLLEDFDPRSSSWLVPDLRSKFEIQQRLLERDGAYLDTSVLRASDLWKILLKKRRPELRVVTRDWIRVLIRHELDTRKIPGMNATAERTVLETMDRFAGLVFDPLGQEHLDGLEDEDPEVFRSWKPSIEVARDLLLLLRDRHLVVPQWVSAVLLAEEDLAQDWKTPLWVDLGVQLSGTEALLLQNLSRQTDVNLVEPSPAWRTESSFVLQAYESLAGWAQSDATIETGPQRVARTEHLRFGSQLGEVKEAVARVRSWLEEGVAPEKIAILAPDIEVYWPFLRSYFAEEGVPVDKAVAVKLNSLPPVTRWLSNLRTRSRDLDRCDLEHAFYPKISLRFEEFQALFAHLYAPEDLSRHAEVEEAYRRGPRFTETSNLREFLMAAAHLWEGNADTEGFSLLLREIYQNVPESTVLRLRDWVGYCESVAAAKEITLEPAAEGGVLVTNFWSAHSTRVERRIFLGLCDELLRESSRNPLPLPLARKLSEIGFHQEHPDHSLLEFELRWLADSGTDEDLFFVASSGFEGQPLTASPFWLRAFLEKPGADEKDTEKIRVPRLPNWDLRRLQDDPSSSRPDWSEARRVGLRRGLDRDAGRSEASPWSVEPPRRLSPSKIEAYAKCPFKYAAGQLLRLKDLEELDVDLGAAGLGSFNHALFARLTDDGWIFRSEDEESLAPRLEELIEQVRVETDLQLPDEKAWLALKARQLKTAQKFLRVEKAWQREHPRRRFHRSESEWKISFDVQSGAFTPGEGRGDLVISGRIDRLESDGDGRWVVIDYKSGARSIDHHPKWIADNTLQLLFYMWAVEKGALENVTGEVIGAFYYLIRDASRDKGFQIEAAAGALFPSAGRKGSRATVEDKEHLFGELERRIVEVVARMREGFYGPKPFDQKICDTCEWRTLCRAPHLN